VNPGSRACDRCYAQHPEQYDTMPTTCEHLDLTHGQLPAAGPTEIVDNIPWWADPWWLKP